MKTAPLYPRPTPAGSTGGPPPTAALRSIDSSTLLGAARVVHITHGDQRYTLRLTRENKLILTK